ncbi:hypothetical protein [Microbacterium sp. NPDC056569]|uniref:hypothetical protein n=1 Tax=Microbacterium sp. NPDC056569 TaxID=3345867 RepID=UPI00366DA424
MGVRERYSELLKRLEVNGAVADLTTDDAFGFVLNVARSRIGIPEIAGILREASTP